jgi:putative peptidoglycan lipid II flippase
MKRFSQLSKNTLLVAFSFGANKVLAILRQLIIARQFGLSSELDVFNVANNVPDMLYSLISGGALAMAIIPVLSEVITQKNRGEAWRVFSQVANIAFLVTAILSVLVAIFAWPLVQHSLGIAPGFSLEQQELVVRLMRLNLVATMIFSMAGLLIAGLQANQHFLFPAIAPILYNVGQIFGAVVLSPDTGYRFLGLSFPGFGMGVDGLVYGVLIGSALFFMIQIPGLIQCKFKWHPQFIPNHPDVRKILAMLGPRVASMLFYQLTFIARDNIASRLPLGSVTALTYGWMIQQVPETLIGTAIGTAVLPTISALIAKKDLQEFKATTERVIRVMIGISVPLSVLMAVVLPPFINFAFGFEARETNVLLWTTRAFLAGLLGHVLLELGSRLFFARQNATIPLAGSALNLAIYILSGSILGPLLQAPGVGLADSIAFTAQAVFLLVVFSSQVRREPGFVDRSAPGRSTFLSTKIWSTILRALLGSLVAGVAGWLALSFLPDMLPDLLVGVLAALLSGGLLLPVILPEIRMAFRL